MFDTINCWLTQGDLPGRVDFLGELPGHLTDVAETERRSTGERWLSGKLGNLTIRANPYSVFVGGGSLCKWYLGDNFQILGLSDTRRAVEALGDSLHLPIWLAKVTRMDVAANLIMSYPVGVYLDHLGDLGRAKRLQQPDSVYYQQAAKQMVFYDKIKEEKAHHEPIPELYAGVNVLRYERRATKRITKVLKVPEVRASMLYDRDFYNKMIAQWADDYKAIQKITYNSVDFKMIQTKKDLYNWGLSGRSQSIGGQAEMLRQIAEARRRGDLTAKQAYDMRAAVKQACKADGVLVEESDAIQELDRKVAEAVKMYS